MDFEKMINNYKTKTCVMSVEKFPDGSYGNIRIVAGNKAHCDDVGNLHKRPFIPNSPYEEYFPKNINFEDFCYRSAFLGQPMHTYINLYEMGLWLNLFMLPLVSDSENIGYCLYSYDVAPKPDSEAMSELSYESSSAVLKTCIKLRGTDDFQASVDEVIADIRDICDANRCCVFILDRANHKCSILCEAKKYASDTHSAKELINDAFYDIACTWEDTLEGSTCLIMKNQADMDILKERNPVWLESLRKANVKSLVLLPLNYNGENLGYIWATNFDTENYMQIKETLELSSFFLASEIANHQLLHRLEVLSSIDLLTGIKNRNVMNNRVDRIISGQDSINEPYAIIFADLNGLKRVNDLEGHDAGDNMLKAAASMLQGIFYDCEVYRAGGDEFMIIATDITQEELDKRISLLRTQSESSKNVRFAIGTDYVDNDHNIITAMRTADAKMYQDKNAYYLAHPKLKYR